MVLEAQASTVGPSDITRGISIVRPKKPTSSSWAMTSWYCCAMSLARVQVFALKGRSIALGALFFRFAERVDGLADFARVDGFDLAPVDREDDERTPFAREDVVRASRSDVRPAMSLQQAHQLANANIGRHGAAPEVTNRIRACSESEEPLPRAVRGVLLPGFGHARNVKPV